LAGLFSGTFKIDEDFYELHDLGAGKRILLRKDYAGLFKRCGSNDSEEEEQRGEIIEDRTEGRCPVRVLALTTAAAQAALPDINGTIALAINQTNQALRNSQVYGNDLTLTLVGISTITFSESAIMRDDRESLIDNAELKIKRNTADADIVLVLVEGDYGDDFIGMAGTLTLQSERAVVIINATDALSDYNTSHELAHLFGCRHEPDADATGPIEHAHKFITGCWPFRKDRNTIMFSEVTGHTIQHYSNPNVKYKNRGTGVTDERENWRKLRANACTVATFRNQSIPALSAHITGPYVGCLCSWITVNPIVSGGYILELPCEEGEGVYLVSVFLVEAQCKGKIINNLRQQVLFFS